MKINCGCGGVIVDQTDYLPNKGYIIADQDWFDFLDAIDKAVEQSGENEKTKECLCSKISSLAINLTKLIYQCPTCGRLYVENDHDELEIFAKVEQFRGNGILRSAYGDAWKSPLIATWDDEHKGMIKGYLWCVDLKRGEESFESWEQLEKQYYLLFDELQEKNLLRSALLKRNQQVIHVWEMEAGI